MPEQLSIEEIEEIVAGAIEEVEATTMKELGKVMGKFMPLTKGKADGSQVKKVIEQKLK